MSLFMFSIALIAAPGEDQSVRLNHSLREYVAARAAEFGEIPEERKEQLSKIADYVRGRIKAGQPARLVFICTHNSRRSHLSQIWAQTAASHYGAANVETFSGGTEATAFNPRAVNALKRAGFMISEPPAGENPRYQVRFHDDAPPMECFSKVYSESPNPTADFCAVMTCSQADQNCPQVRGAALRIALPFDDPKAFDGTPEEAAKYDERCRQIAREMLFVFASGLK
ncbi:MAG TPA: protein-tyrosine-phosphatase [Pirellulaceae bacterium]|nr:protein-tyrosine-phosphatase [Pirellulaceae bacterium]